MKWLSRRRELWLLNRAADLRKHSTRVGANQAHHPGNDDEDHSQHDGVFSDILSFGISPQPFEIAVDHYPLDSCASQRTATFAIELEDGV